MLIQYELKKILKSKLCLISMICLLLWLIASIIWTVQSATWLDGSSGTTIHGLEAIKQEKLDKDRWSGTLTEDIIARVISANQDYIHSADYDSKDLTKANIAHGKTIGYSDIRELINRSFGEFSSYDYYTIDRLSKEDAMRFYNNRIKQVEDWINSESVHRPEKEEEKILELVNTVDTPFFYTYMGGWIQLMEQMSIVLMPMIFVICIILSQVFSMEFHSGQSNILLSTKLGRKHSASTKIVASGIIASSIYIIVMAIYTISILGLYGVQGYACQIQSNSNLWKAIYNWSNVEAYAMLVLMGFLGCLLLSSLAVLLSALFRSSLGAIAISFIVIIIPQMISVDSIKILNKIITLFPHETMIGIKKLVYYNFYNIFGTVYTSFQVVPILYSVLIIIMNYFTVKVFRRYYEV